MKKQQAQTIAVSPHGVIDGTVVLRHPGAKAGDYRNLFLPVRGQGCVVAIARRNRDVEIAVDPSTPSRAATKYPQLFDAKINLGPGAQGRLLAIGNPACSFRDSAHPIGSIELHALADPGRPFAESSVTRLVTQALIFG